MTRGMTRLVCASFLVMALGTPAAATSAFELDAQSPSGSSDLDVAGNSLPSAEVSAAGSAAASQVGASAAADDAIPGVPLPASPFSSDLNSRSDPSDVYHVLLNQGDVFSVTLTVTGASAGFRPSLFLYPPATSSLLTQPDWVATSATGPLPKTLSYTAAQTGAYYLDVFQSPFSTTEERGGTAIAWTVSSPVFRFYNGASGTHFFTPSLQERNMVVALWSNVFSYEGIAYHTQPYANTQPLYRFYNTRSASHFYTASIGEAQMVIARWSNVFTYEGETYKVSVVGPPGAAVYRFYNMRNGSHFFTASAVERDHVIATWPTIFQYEGPAFYLNP